MIEHDVYIILLRGLLGDIFWGLFCLFMLLNQLEKFQKIAIYFLYARECL